MSDEIRAEIKTAAKALCHYPSGPHPANSCCSGIGRCEMKAAIAEITPGLCETVSLADRVKASVRGRRFINPPIGWAINYEEPWELTDTGILALMDPGEIDKIHAELSRHD